jgi:hypothetical protein
LKEKLKKKYSSGFQFIFGIFSNQMNFWIFPEFFFILKDKSIILSAVKTKLNTFKNNFTISVKFTLIHFPPLNGIEQFR